MAEYSKLVTTSKGQALLIKSATEMYDIKFTKVCTSDMVYTESQLESLTILDDIKQTGTISKISRIDSTIKVETVLTNANLSDGYYMRTLGLYANDPDEEGEILYAVCVSTDDNCYMPAYSGISSTGIYINMYQTVGNASNISLEVDSGVYATIGDIQELTQLLNNHFADTNNPHNVTKEQIGLGDVDNTADLNKPVSLAVQESLDAYYAQLTAYSDKAIADLINGAPTTLDTLKELADAIKENQDVQAALDAAIGTKANAAEFDTHTSTIASKTVAGHVKVDDVLSASSTNPVQNKVVKAELDDVWEKVYPVGAIYISTVNTSPATLFGGKWEQITSGYLRAGTSYATKTDGSNTATGAATGNTGSTTLTASQSGVPEHTHTMNHSHNIHFQTRILDDGDGYTVTTFTSTTNAPTQLNNYTGATASHSGNTGSNTGASASSGHTHTLNSHTHPINLNYVQVYMWKRTA